MLGFHRRVRRMRRLRLSCMLLVPALSMAAILHGSILLTVAAIGAALALVVAHVSCVGAVCPKCNDRFFVVGSDTAPFRGAAYDSDRCVHCGARLPHAPPQHPSA